MTTRTLHTLIVALTATTLLAFTACTGYNAPGDAESAVAKSIDTIPMMVRHVQRCSRLYTTELHVHKIVTHDDVVRLRGSLMDHSFSIALPLGDRKVAIPMDATIKAYIDFADFSEKNVERTADGRIAITLPDPRLVLTSSKINQKEIKEYLGVARSPFTDQELSNYENQGRQAIIASLPLDDIARTARENAARVIIPLVCAAGYDEKDVTVTFRSDFEFDLKDIADIKRVLK